MAAPRQDLLDRIDRCLDKFKARRVADIEETYAYYPDKAKARMGSGSFGETYRMKSKAHPNEPARVVKFIAKARVATNDLQIQHLCVELAVLKLVRHPNLNCSTDLLHNATHIFLVLEMCVGEEPNIETRLYHLFSRSRCGTRIHTPRMATVPLLLETLAEECVGLSPAEVRAKEDELMERVCGEIG